MKAHCINLKERTDRWEQVQSQFELLGLEVERFDAIKRKRGHDGCILSHMALWKQLKDEGVFMIVEDDLKVIVDNPKEILSKAMSQLPKDWDMLYLGATLNQQPERISENLVKIEKAWTTHAIIYNNQNGVVDAIINKMDMYKVDVVLADVIQKEFNCFMTYPMICSQAEGFSNIVNKYTDYHAITDRYKKYTT